MMFLHSLEGDFQTHPTNLVQGYIILLTVAMCRILLEAVSFLAALSLHCHTDVTLAQQHI